MKIRILVAEDEHKIANLLCDYLVAADFDASHIDDGANVLDAVGVHQPDLLLLDVMLPNVDGLTLCKEIRARSDLPIIMLTARSEEIDRLLGLELGADDYISKPFSPREVVARIKAVLRRTQGSPTPSSLAPDIQIDAHRMRITVEGRRLDLTPVEFHLLSVLAEHPGRVYRRSELLDLIYDDFRDVSDRTIDSHIKNLRRKLAEILGPRELILSVYGVGYKLDFERFSQPGSSFAPRMPNSPTN